MVPHSQAIQTAELEWQWVDGIDIPVSKQFGDVYFSKANGLLETRHVFIEGNDLPERLAQLEAYQYFTVAETGFGTGLNMLALWQLWDQVKPNNHSWLHFISVEKFPLSRPDLQRALAVWPELAHWASQLIANYPLPIAGCHRLCFPEARFSIDLWLGDAQGIFPTIQHESAVNAWFLDGFAPSCNPELWQANVMDHIVRLSCPGTTFASFSVAGVLKRGLQQHGVIIQRPKGFGHKREMLKAHLPIFEEENSIAANDRKELPPATQQPPYAVVGAGIAGLSMAWALAQRGHQVFIFDAEHPLAGASGNPRALLNPKLCPIEQSAEHLMTIAWQFSQHYYAQFPSAFNPLAIDQIVLKNAEDALALVEQYPTGILSARDCNVFAHQAQGIVLHQAATVEPHALATHILSHRNIHFHQAKISQVLKHANHFELISDTASWTAQDVIVACAQHTPQLIADCPDLKPIRGQVSWFNVKHHLALDRAYSYGGYALPLSDHQLLIGASFYPNRADNEVQLEDHQHNLDLIQSLDPDFANTLPDINNWQGRAAVRAQSRDYFPVIGRKSEERAFMIAGLGSKGFLFAPLLAELSCALILKESVSVPQALLQKLCIQRFDKATKVKKPYFKPSKND